MNYLPISRDFILSVMRLKHQWEKNTCRHECFMVYFSYMFCPDEGEKKGKKGGETRDMGKDEQR